MTAREEVLRARKTLLNGSDKLAYFEDRGISRRVVESAWIGYDPGRKAFTYPCIARSEGLLGIHLKSELRDANDKRQQWWEGYKDDLPCRGYGKNPDNPAKVIPFGLETLRNIKPGSRAVLCCGEEDALSLRQAGFTALSQPGAGLLEPVYAAELAGLEIVVFYDVGEEAEARKDAIKAMRAGAAEVRVVEWPPDAPNGADINGRLVEDPEGFESWVAGMIDTAKPLSNDVEHVDREGAPDNYATPTCRLPESRPWPTLRSEALYGLPGEIVRAIEPHSEADPVAVLANLLGAFGNAIGRGSYALVSSDRHHLNLDIALVGETAKGRKGMSWGPIRELMHAADPGWADERVQNGLSSGEGLINAVRDKVVSGEDEEGEPIVYDEGVEDKRFFVIEGEFASVLSVMRRQGNTLSAVIRQSWDGDRLQVLTRKDPMKATGAHISIVGHITKAELLRHLTETESANGFANRFMWVMAKRSKKLPFGGEWHTLNTAPMVKLLSVVLKFGKSAGEIRWGETAWDLWRERYGPLSEGKPGLFGAVVGRAEAQVLRLAALYAVMDESPTIEREHLTAALALWDYAEDSARYIFGDATGDPVADRIVDALWAAGKDGRTRTEIRDLFGRHKSKEEIDRALALLLKMGSVRQESEDTGGRPTERWFSR